MTADFDDRAATWDDDPAKAQRALEVADAIVAALPLGPSTRLLEYGAGTGLVTQALRDHVGPVTLADTSAGMREQMERKVAAGLIADARVVDLDLSTGEVPDERFDIIVTSMVLHHIDPLEPVLNGFARLLDPGGHLCVVDLEAEDGSFHGDSFHGHRGFVPEELAAQIASAGLEVVATSRIGHIERGDAWYPIFLVVAQR